MYAVLFIQEQKEKVSERKKIPRYFLTKNIDGFWSSSFFFDS
jgi:hypothetical protein